MFYFRFFERLRCFILRFANAWSEFRKEIFCFILEFSCISNRYYRCTWWDSFTNVLFYSRVPPVTLVRLTRFWLETVFVKTFWTDSTFNLKQWTSEFTLWVHQSYSLRNKRSGNFKNYFWRNFVIEKTSKLLWNKINLIKNSWSRTRV